MTLGAVTLAAGSEERNRNCIIFYLETGEGDQEEALKINDLNHL